MEYFCFNHFHNYLRSIAVEQSKIDDLSFKLMGSVLTLPFSNNEIKQIMTIIKYISTTYFFKYKTTNIARNKIPNIEIKWLNFNFGR